LRRAQRAGGIEIAGHDALRRTSGERGARESKIDKRPDAPELRRATSAPAATTGADKRKLSQDHNPQRDRRQGRTKTKGRRPAIIFELPDLSTLLKRDVLHRAAPSPG
jgi:hypothetical protein